MCLCVRALVNEYECMRDCVRMRTHICSSLMAVYAPEARLTAVHCVTYFFPNIPPPRSRHATCSSLSLLLFQYHSPGNERERERERERDRQTDRQTETERQREREGEGGQTYRRTVRAIETQKTDRQTDRQRQRDRERERGRGGRHTGGRLERLKHKKQGHRQIDIHTDTDSETDRHTRARARAPVHEPKNRGKELRDNTEKQTGILTYDSCIETTISLFGQINRLMNKCIYQ